MIEPAVLLIFFIALFTQSLAGFGSALISMPLLVPLLGIRVAAPLFALVILVAEMVMLLRYRASFRFGSIWRLMVGSFCGIPVGVLVIRTVDERIVLTVLGLITAGYALYALLGPSIPHLKSQRWGFLFGFTSGILSGAYNTGGPPYVIYATSKRWHPAEFKSNIQGLFLVSSMIVIVSHLLAGNITLDVLRRVVIVLPAALLALFMGFRLDKYIPPALFRRGVLVVLLILGLSLIF